MKKIPLKIYTVSIVVCLIMVIQLSPQNHKESIFSVLGFDRGIKAVTFDIEKESILSKETNKKIETAKDCGRCHSDIYNNWLTSRHRVSHSNELYQYSFKLEPLEWCENCHAPLREKNSNNLFLANEGISCNVCHIRDQKVIVATKPKFDVNSYHDYIELKEFGSAELCKSCHDFNFPTWQTFKSNSKHIEFSNLSMQGTFDEWNESSFKSESDCIDCHLMPGTKKSHTFFGGHSSVELSNSFLIKSYYVSANTIAVEVISLRIGHAFPTGDLFRALKLKLFSTKGKLIKEIVLSKKYRVTTPGERKENESPKLLIADTRIPPPKDKDNTGKIVFYVDVENRPISIKIQLWLDYLNDVEKLLSTVKEKSSKTLILDEVIKIENRNHFNESDSG
jgi:hypothetical protein